MAKKKHYRRKKAKKVKRSAPKKKALAPLIGTGVGGYRAVTRTSTTGHKLLTLGTGGTQVPYQNLFSTNVTNKEYARKVLLQSLIDAATALDVWAPVVAGAAFEYARKVPVLREVPKAGDTVLRSLGAKKIKA